MLDLIIKKGKCYIGGELKDVDVAFKNGKLHVEGKQQNLIKFLELHPLNGRIFREHNKVEIAESQLDYLEFKVEAMKYAKEIDIDSFVSVKNWKAIGNKLIGYNRLSSFMIAEKDTQKSSDENDSENMELTLF